MSSAYGESGPLHGVSPDDSRHLTTARLLDCGVARTYAWVVAIWHGIGAALLYPAAGYVVTAYCPESRRGRYVAAMWCSQLSGNVVGSGR